jgi:hypothetical protein
MKRVPFLISVFDRLKKIVLSFQAISENKKASPLRLAFDHQNQDGRDDRI